MAILIATLACALSLFTLVMIYRTARCVGMLEAQVRQNRSADGGGGQIGEAPRAKRRWLSMRLRTLMALLLLLGVVFGMLGRELHRAHRQSTAVDAMQGWGAAITYDFQESSEQSQREVDRAGHQKAPRDGDSTE